MSAKRTKITARQANVDIGPSVLYFSMMEEPMQTLANFSYCQSMTLAISQHGGQEIARILYRHILTEIPPSVEEINFFSDSCPEQNKNIGTDCHYVFVRN